MTWMGSILAALSLVTGQVSDGVDGRPLGGVVVQVEGEVTSTVTDAGGAFRLETDGPSLLVVSRTGYDTLRIQVRGDTVLALRMSPSPLVLEGIEEATLYSNTGQRAEQSAFVTSILRGWTTALESSRTCASGTLNGYDASSKSEGSPTCASPGTTVPSSARL